jgi:hypothetical protein
LARRQRHWFEDDEQRHARLVPKDASLRREFLSLIASTK